ncbi:TPA: hypothetical protein ACPULA_005510, partial [Klebsiella pneumoniae]
NRTARVGFRASGLCLVNPPAPISTGSEWGDLTPLVLTDKKSVSVRPYVARLPRHLSPSHRIWRALAGHQMMIKQLLYN